MKPIPIEAAREIAERYGWDQVVVIARKIGSDPEPHGEHVTTFGNGPAHAAVAARIGDFLKLKAMGWTLADSPTPPEGFALVPRRPTDYQLAFMRTVFEAAYGRTPGVDLGFIYRSGVAGFEAELLALARGGDETS